MIVQILQIFFKFKIGSYYLEIQDNNQIKYILYHKDSEHKNLSIIPSDNLICDYKITQNITSFPTLTVTQVQNYLTDATYISFPLNVSSTELNSHYNVDLIPINSFIPNCEFIRCNNKITVHHTKNNNEFKLFSKLSDSTLNKNNFDNIVVDKIGKVRYTKKNTPDNMWDKLNNELVFLINFNYYKQEFNNINTLVEVTGKILMFKLMVTDKTTKRRTICDFNVMIQ